MRRTTTKAWISTLLIALLGVIVLMASGAPDYTETVRIVGVDAAGDLVVVSLDAAGHIIAVLQGEHGGVLHTLATDEDGRLLAIITDPENIWGVRPSIGNAELAARLGSPSTYDRGGQVGFSEIFANGLNAWREGSIGLGGGVTLQSEWAAMGGYTAHLVAGSNLAASASIWHYEPITDTTTRIGIEWRFSFDGLSAEVTLDAYLYTGTLLFRFSIQYDHANCRLRFLNDRENYETIDAALILYPEEGFFNTAKLIVDMTTKRYVKLLLNNVSYDLSAEPLYGGINAIRGNLRIRFDNIGPGGNNPNVYIDRVIVTVQEPED